MTGDVVTDARVSPGRHTEGMAVDFSLDARGTKQFGDLTTRQRRAQPGHRARRDGRVGADHPRADHRRPRADHGPLRRSRRRRTSRTSCATARCPAPLKLQEERTVGPSLGRDSIRQGSLSFVVGSLAVFLFMIVYYRGGGSSPTLALLTNVLFVLGASRPSASR